MQPTCSHAGVRHCFWLHERLNGLLWNQRFIRALPLSATTGTAFKSHRPNALFRLQPSAEPITLVLAPDPPLAAARINRRGVWVLDLEKARRLEAGRYKAALAELESEAQAKIDGRTRQTGLQHPSATFQIRLQKQRGAIDCRIAIRRELVPHVPEFGSAAELNALENLIQEDITRFWVGWQNRGMMIDGYLLSELREHARNGISVLKEEIELNLHKQSGPSGPFSVNTGGGPAILNLGVIYGNVHQVIENVGASGQAELAQALSRITDAIKAEERLGDERAALLEQVGFVAEQSTAPAAERKTGAVKGMLLGLRAGVQDVANVAQILSVAGPVIARHFGLQWPI